MNYGFMLSVYDEEERLVLSLVSTHHLLCMLHTASDVAGLCTNTPAVN